MNNMPLVSVFMPIYNQKFFVKEAIESILTQDYENIEIVACDDGSTDGTQEILKEYHDKYPNKFVLQLSKKNQGITKNCNICLAACKGKYIAFFAGDDLMLSGKIRKQVEYMEKHPNCTICYHNLESFDSDTGKTLSHFNNKNNSHQGDVRLLIKYGMFNGGLSNMVRREQIPINGYDDRVPIASDWLFFMEILINGGEINYINEVLGKYRIHNENTVSTKVLACYLDHFKSSIIIIKKYPRFFIYVLFRYFNALKNIFFHNF